MRRLVASLMTLALVSFVPLDAQQQRPASPEGIASTQVNGRWIDIVHGKPILRGRTNVFGAGADYGKTLFDGGTVWRAGANVLTRLRTEVPLALGGKGIPPGEYTLFVDMKSRTDWTLIVSSQPAQAADDVPTRSKVWEAFVYAPEKDVARAQMNVERLPYSMEQLTWAFTDVTGAAGTLRLMWDSVMASVAFTVAR